MLNATDLIAAIRNDRRIGRGTCSTIDECYDDAELVTAFGDEPTIKAALKAAYRLEGLRMDAMLNARFGDDDDVELKIKAEWDASAKRVLSPEQKAKKAARARARRAARKFGQSAGPCMHPGCWAMAVRDSRCVAHMPEEG